MNIVPKIERRAHLGGFFGPPLADQIGAKSGLLEGTEWIGNDELADRNADCCAPKANHLPGQTLGQSVRREGTKGQVAYPLILFEDRARRDDSPEPLPL